MTAFDEAMRERAARILAELEYVQSCACDTLRHALGRYVLARGLCKRRARFKFNSRPELAFKFKFRPCRSAFKFHHRGRRRLNFAAMRVRYPKLSVAIQNAVKFYLLDTARRF